MVTPIVLAHGFTQTARSWHTIERLIEQHEFGPLIALDMPGHGNASLGLDLWASATDIVERGGRATYVGYSMGGRIALHAALAHPDHVERLVLIGATAGIDDSSQRAQRKSADNALADRIESIGVERFIDEWLSQALFAGLTSETSQRADRLRNTASGLASSLRLAGTGTQEPLWDRLVEIDVPVLLLAGEQDNKFQTIAEQMQALLPHASVVSIENAGHSVHLEQPAATVDAIVRWLQSTSEGETGGCSKTDG